MAFHQLVFLAVLLLLPLFLSPRMQEWVRFLPPLQQASRLLRQLLVQGPLLVLIWPLPVQAVTPPLVPPPLVPPPLVPPPLVPPPLVPHPLVPPALAPPPLVPPPLVPP